MPLPLHSLTWEGLAAGGDGDLQIDAADPAGIRGLDLPQIDLPAENASRAGVVGGASYQRALTVQARLLALTSDALIEFRAAMAPIVDPTDERPLSFAGLGWPGEHRVYVRPAGCEFGIGAPEVYGDCFTVDAGWLASEPVVYSEEQTNASVVSTGSPVSTTTFEAANAGVEVPWARRAWEFRLTAHGTVTSPRIRVDHADGSFEQVTLAGLTMTGGQVLTVRDGLIRVGSRMVHGYARSLTEAGVTGRTVRLWRLLSSTGSDGANEVTMSVASGAFSGFCKVRSTW